MSKNELIRYFLNNDYKSHLLEVGYSELKAEHVVKSTLRQFEDDDKKKVGGGDLFFFFPWFLELFPELNEILDGKD